MISGCNDDEVDEVISGCNDDEYETTLSVCEAGKCIPADSDEVCTISIELVPIQGYKFFEGF